MYLLLRAMITHNCVATKMYVLLWTIKHWQLDYNKYVCGTLDNQHSHDWIVARVYKQMITKNSITSNLMEI